MSPMGGSGSDGATVVDIPLTATESKSESPRSSVSTSSDEDSVDGNQAEEQMKVLAGQNYYELRKAVVHNIMNVPLLTANISQIRAVISSESGENKFYSCVLGLIITSLGLQFFFFFICIGIHIRERLVDRREKQRALKSSKSKRSIRFIDGRKTLVRSQSHPSGGIALTSPDLQDHTEVDWCLDILNYVSLFIVFAITIINMLTLGLINIPQQNTTTAAR